MSRISEIIDHLVVHELKNLVQHYCDEGSPLGEDDVKLINACKVIINYYTPLPQIEEDEED